MKPPVSKRRAQPWLGTIVEIAVQAASDEQCSSWINEAFLEIQAVHKQMSFHDEDSELSVLNRRAHLESVRCSNSVREVLKFAKEMHRRTDGAVDVSVAPVLVKKNFLPNYFEHETCGTPADIYIEGESVRFAKPLILDLGGIAKGYAVDRAIEKLQALGCTSASVNAGGDLRVYGEKSALFVRLSTNPASLMNAGSIENCAVATSAGYFSENADCVPYVDPETGQCLQRIPSVTVRADSCMLADALTKFVILKNPNAEKLSQFQAQAWVQL